MEIFVLAGFVISIILIAYIWSEVATKIKWNNGICKETNEPWEFSEMIECGHGVESAPGKLYTTKSGKRLIV